jgi:hypothetical protein
VFDHLPVKSAFLMELFLNLCWLALLLPAYLLWRRRVSSQPWTRASFVIVCTLSCALVLLFPVVSASDDLHAVGQAMEESKRSLRHSGNCGCAIHSLNHASLPALTASDSPKVVFEQVGTVFSPSAHSRGILFAPAPTGRAPPVRPVSL